MAVGEIGTSGALGRPRAQAALTDVFAGLVCSILSIAYCLSYAALIFNGPLGPALAYGVAVTFLSAAIGGSIVAWRSSLPFAVAGPDSSISVVLAVLVATVAQRLGNVDPLVPTLIAISATTALTGLLLCILGFTHAGRAIRFVPFPVIGGFLGATGWLMIAGAVQVVTEQKLLLANLGEFANVPMLGKIAAALVVAVILQVALRRSKSSFVMPGILLAALAATYIALLLTGWSLGEAQAHGWMFRPQSTATLISPWQPGTLQSFSWMQAPALAGDVLAVMFVTIINFLLNTTGIELSTRTDANIDRDLKVLGFANIVTAALGGYVSCTSISRSLLVRTAGGSGRLSGLTVAAVSAALLIAGPAFVGYVPKYILGGLLFFLGGGLIYQWLIQSARQLQLIDYLSLIAIALLIINWGFIAGVLTGIVIGCATFALSISRVNAIKFSFDGSEYRSSLDRGPHELTLLAAHGREIQGMALQSYLFFGSANRLYQHVKALLARQRECRFLIFDFQRVTGIDFGGDPEFCADQTSGDRSRRAHRSGQAFSGIGAGVSQRAVHFRRYRGGVRSRPCARVVRTGDHRSAPRADHRLAIPARLALRSARRRSSRRSLVRLLQASGSKSRRHHRPPGRSRDVHAFHPRGPRRHYRRFAGRPNHPRSQLRWTYHGRRDGSDNPQPAQRHHSGRSGKRSLRPRCRSV